MKLLATVIGMAFLSGSGLKADAIYMYVGNNFSSVSDFSSVSSPYTTNDHITATIIFASFLTDSSSLQAAPTPVSWQISDGVVTVDGGSTAVIHFDIETSDGGRNVLEWGFSENTGDPFQIVSSNDPAFSVSDSTYRPFFWLASNVNDPGSWTVTSVPELPGNYMLLTMGIAIAFAKCCGTRRRISACSRSRRRPSVSTFRSRSKRSKDF